MARGRGKRPWPRGLRRRGGRAPLLLPALLGVAAALLCIRAVDSVVRPLVVDIAQLKVKNAVALIIDEAVARTLERDTVSYQDIALIQTDGGGRVMAITTDSVKLNSLRSEIVQEIILRTDALDAAQLGIPLGSLTGLVYASEWGPAIPVRILSVAAADGDFRNEFTSAGINQTLHRIILDITVEIRLIIPGGTAETSVHASVSLAETVIVGEVPQAYLQLQQGEA